MCALTWPSKSSNTFAEARDYTLSEGRRLSSYSTSASIQAADRLFAAARAMEGNRQAFERAWESYPERVDARFRALAGAQPPPKNISLLYTQHHLSMYAGTTLSEIKTLASERSALPILEDITRHETDRDYVPQETVQRLQSLVHQRQTLREVFAAVGIRIETGLVEARSNQDIKRRSYNAQLDGVYNSWDAADRRMRAGGATGADFMGIHGEPSTYDKIQSRFNRLVQGIESLSAETIALKNAALALGIAVSSIEQPTIDGLLAAASQAQLMKL
jgi:DNA-binding transcriptional MerR regulator